MIEPICPVCGGPHYYCTPSLDSPIYKEIEENIRKRENKK